MKKNNIFFGKSKAEISAMARDARQKALDRMVKKSKAADRAKEKSARGDPNFDRPGPENHRPRAPR